MIIKYFYIKNMGGVSRYFVEIASVIMKQHNVSIGCLWSENEYLNNAYKGRRSFINRIVKWKISKSLTKLYCKLDILFNQYDIVHPTWVDTYIYGVKHSSKIVVTIHDMIHEIFWSNKEQYEIRRKKLAIYNSDAIIAISNNTKKDILRLYPDIDEKKITVIYHGTSHLPKPTKIEGFDLNSRYLLYVGSRFDYKNGFFVAEALKDLLKSKKNLKLVYVGGGAFNHEELKFIKENKLDDLIVQLSVSDSGLAYLYRHAVCFIYPSLYEGFGLPILEAFDNECPVICANNSSLPEVGGEAALYFNNNDAEGLVDLVSELLDNDSKRKNLISLGKERAKLFSWEKCSNETIMLYKKLLADK